MLLINIATIYQGRIPTFRHTQLHAETLSRSHLKYVLTGELDTYVIRFIRELTNQARRIIRNPHTRKTTHTNPTATTHNNPTTAPPTSTFSSRKRTYTTTQTPTPNQPTPHSPTQNPPKNSPPTQCYHPTQRPPVYKPRILHPQ